MKSVVTVVTGYWDVKNKYNKDYSDWLSKTLLINCPYVFFGDENTIKIAKEIREKANYPTVYVKLEISEFYGYSYYDKIQSHEIHCPSKEINLIWLEKVLLVERAKKIDPYQSSFFIWVDAGIFVFREKYPPLIEFPNERLLLSLPKNKITFTSSDCPYFESCKVSDYNYYHYVAAGCLVFPKDIVDSFSELYRTFLDNYLQRHMWMYTEQVILTYIYIKHQDLFHHVGHGYGEMINFLYQESP